MEQNLKKKNSIYGSHLQLSLKSLKNIKSEDFENDQVLLRSFVWAWSKTIGIGHKRLQDFWKQFEIKVLLIMILPFQKDKCQNKRQKLNGENNNLSKFYLVFH
jgi:hypothetical protein